MPLGKGSGEKGKGVKYRRAILTQIPVCKNNMAESVKTR